MRKIGRGNGWAWIAAVAVFLPGVAFGLENINIATATTAGVYYPLGNAMAQLFNTKIPGLKASAQATAGTPQNILLMQKKEAEVAFAQNGVAYYAYNGLEMFKEKPVKMLRGITHLYPNVMQIAVAADSGIRSVKDLEGKGFVPGAVGSATEVNSREILGLYGLDYREKKNVKADYLGYGEAANALKDGRTSGILIAGGLPTAAVMDVAASVQLGLTDAVGVACFLVVVALQKWVRRLAPATAG